MSTPFVIDNLAHRLADTLDELLARSVGKPLDIATAYFSISGYKIVKDGLHKLGGFRLLLGTDPQSGADVGLKVDPQALKARIKGDLEAEPFTEETLKLVEDLITYLQAEKVEIRLYDKGFLHAKAYRFHQDQIGPQNLADRMRPFAAIVGSSNFTGPGLATNRELNLVHRVFLPADEPRDADAARGEEFDVYSILLKKLLVPGEIAAKKVHLEPLDGEPGVLRVLAWFRDQGGNPADVYGMTSSRRGVSPQPGRKRTSPSRD
jgi:PLD-like domain